MRPKEFFKKLFEVGAVKIDTRPGYGFKMRIHDTQPDAPLSPIYLNLRTPDNPKPGPLTLELVAEIGRILWNVVEESDIAFDGICGIPNAGVPLVKAFDAAAFSDSNSHSPILTLRKEVRNNKPAFTGIADNDGLGATNFKKNRQNHVLLIDDVITYGGTKDGAVKVFIKQGYTIKTILVFCDRQQGGTEHLYNKQGIKLESAFTLSNIVDMLRSIGCVSPADCSIVLKYLEETRVQ
ncbi:MAG: hypothetical protein Q7S26_01025 [bacterium]|nr:hypothetical protein [bacterium]